MACFCIRIEYFYSSSPLGGIDKLKLQLVVKIWDWSKRFSSETKNNNDLVLDNDVKKKVRAGSSIFYELCLWLVICMVQTKIYLLRYKNLVLNLNKFDAGKLVMYYSN